MGEGSNPENKTGIDPAYLKPVLTPEQDRDLLAFLKSPEDESAATVSGKPKRGDEMPDGTIYAGISPDTGKPMYAAPFDTPLVYSFNQAQEYDAKLNVEESNPTKRTWRVPTKHELNVLYKNRNKGNLKSTFNKTGSGAGGWYWSSSSTNKHNGWAQRFSDGEQSVNFKYLGSSLRCVR
jgi:hypothetical protein